jgi:hypothetical protein
VQGRAHHGIVAFSPEYPEYVKHGAVRFPSILGSLSRRDKSCKSPVILLAFLVTIRSPIVELNEKRVQSTRSVAAAADGAAGCCGSRAEACMLCPSSGTENRFGRRGGCHVRALRCFCAGRQPDFQSCAQNPFSGPHHIAAHS